MKKIFSILTIVCALFLGSTMANAKNVTGTWSATKAVLFDEDGNRATVGIENFGVEATITFGVNNSIEFNFEGETGYGTYHFEGNVLFITIDDVAHGFYTNFVNENTMEMDFSEMLDENIMFVFEKKSTSQKATTPPPAAPYTGPTNLIGTWKATSATAVVEGTEVDLDLALIGAEMVFVFTADKKLVATVDGQTESGTYDFDGKKITITSEGETESIAVKFLSADKFNIHEPESGATLYFERQ
jgi:hypothetical protein